MGVNQWKCFDLINFDHLPSIIYSVSVAILAASCLLLLFFFPLADDKNSVNNESHLFGLDIWKLFASDWR